MSKRQEGVLLLDSCHFLLWLEHFRGKKIPGLLRAKLFSMDRGPVLCLPGAEGPPSLTYPSQEPSCDSVPSSRATLAIGVPEPSGELSSPLLMTAVSLNYKSPPSHLFSSWVNLG